MTKAILSEFVSDILTENLNRKELEIGSFGNYVNTLLYLKVKKHDSPNTRETDLQRGNNINGVLPSSAVGKPANNQG